jgi:glycine hydroxymethyltransferase
MKVVGTRTELPNSARAGPRIDPHSPFRQPADSPGAALPSEDLLMSSTSSAFFGASLAEQDPALARVVAGELARQQNQIELIASENIVSRAVLEAQGSILTNKYAEGYPGKRYYGGCEVVDIAEELAIERARSLFGCAYANVQPHSGAQANQAVFTALIKPGDPILGMSLDAGGHLTHGAKANQSGKWFQAHSYGVRLQDGRIDLDEVRTTAKATSPADKGTDSRCTSSTGGSAKTVGIAWRMASSEAPSTS